jgi:hypothetical protein
MPIKSQLHFSDADIGALADRLLAAILKRLDAGVKRDPSIAGFCKRKDISRSHYVNLRRAGLGPREAAVGRRRIITPQAEADWDAAAEQRAAGDVSIVDTSTNTKAALQSDRP